MIQNILVVCVGNICRSPYAEAYAKSIGLKAISCGTYALTDATANHNAIQVGEARGIELFDHRSRNVGDVLFAPDDLVLGFDMTQVRSLENIKREYGSQVSMVGIWGSLAGNTVPDPHGCSSDYFDRCFSNIENSITAIFDKIQVVDDVSQGAGKGMPQE